MSCDVCEAILTSGSNAAQLNGQCVTVQMYDEQKKTAKAAQEQ